MDNLVYIYPDNLDLFYRGTVYQIKDPIDGTWSKDKTLSHACESTKSTLWNLIRRKGIRIVPYYNNNE